MTKPIEIKPATFERGVPKEEHNSFFGDGVAEKLLDLPIDTQLTAVVTYRLADDVTRKGKHTRYPVLAVDHIEVIWDDDRKATVEEQRDEEYSQRTGADKLDFSSVTDGGVE